MTTTPLPSAQIWPYITELIRSSRVPTYCAFPFLAAGALELLPLREGDMLMVKASDQGVRSTMTDLDVLAAFVGWGVEVRSVDSLHAKMVVAKRRVVIGSMNASRRSAEGPSEVATVTTDKTLVTEARSFIKGCRSFPLVDMGFIEGTRERLQLDGGDR